MAPQWCPRVFTPSFVASSPAFLAFDCLLLLSLIYTAAVTPFELGFLWRDFEWGLAAPLRHPAAGWVFVLNRLVDAVFVAHLLVVANTAVPIQSTARDVGKLVLSSNRRIILRAYLSSGALPADLLASFPLDLLLPPGRNHLAVVVLRALRVLKLRYLFSAVSDNGRSSLPRLKAHVDALHLKSGHLRLTSFLLVTVVLSHLLACGLHLVAVFQEQNFEQGAGCNWVSTYFNTYRPDLYQCTHPYSCSSCSPLTPPPALSSLYLAALVWSVETMTTVGYGDVVAVTDAEHAYVVIAMLVGGAFFSFVVGSFISVIQELGEREAHARRTLDVLNDFLAQSGVVPSLAGRLRRYTRSQLDGDPSSAEARKELHSLLDTLTPALRVEIAMSTQARVYAHLPLLGGAPVQLLIECSFGFKHMTFPPGEQLCHAGTDARRGLVIFLQSGMVHVDDPLRDKERHLAGALVSKSLRPAFVANLLLGEEAVWDAVFPLQRMQLCSTTITAVGTVSCMVMRASALLGVIAQFPGYMFQLRRPIRSRWMRMRLRLVVAGARRVRKLLSDTRRLNGLPGVSFMSLLDAVRDGSGPSVSPLSLGSASRLSFDGASTGEAMRSSSCDMLLEARRAPPQLAVFIVSCAVPKMYRVMFAAALFIQRVFRGGIVRQRLRGRLTRQRLSTRAMQRLASKLSGQDPAVASLEMLRHIQQQLRSAIEQQEQVVAENVERSAVVRERMRVSAVGVPRASTRGQTEDEAMT